MLRRMPAEHPSPGVGRHSRRLFVPQPKLDRSGLQMGGDSEHETWVRALLRFLSIAPWHVDRSVPASGRVICLLRHQQARVHRPAAEGSQHYGSSAEVFGTGTATNTYTKSSSLSAWVRTTLFHPVPGGPNRSNGVADNCWRFFRSV
jgi:hypothetical protein